MGLDMYLIGRKLVAFYNNPEGFAKLQSIAGFDPSEHSSFGHVSASIGYWRKANAIHRWFVEKVQDGRDECQESHVTREQLLDLRAACKQVLDCVEVVEGQVSNGQRIHPDGRVEAITQPGKVVAQKGLASAVLPTQAGFFFGSTDYDEGYLKDLKDTVEIIDKAITFLDSDKTGGSHSVSYRASW